MRARSAMLPMLAVGLLMAATAATRATSSSVQLLEVRTRQQAGRLAVVLEASAPMAYTSSQPDPFTVVLDLRHVSTAATVNKLSREGAGPVSGVRFEQTTAADGVTVARVFVGLVEPGKATVQSARNEIAIEFPEAAAPTVAREERGGAAPTAPNTTVTAAPAASGGATATELVSVVSEKVDGRSRVRLRGNGVLVPRTVEETRDLPARLVIDLPGVTPKVPSLMAVGGIDLAKIRVATNSSAPLVTRVVLDLNRRVPFSVDSSGRELVIDLGEVPPATRHEPAPLPAAAPLVASKPADAPAPVQVTSTAALMVTPEEPSTTAALGTSGRIAESPIVPATPEPARPAPISRGDVAAGAVEPSGRRHDAAGCRREGRRTWARRPHCRRRGTTPASSSPGTRSASTSKASTCGRSFAPSPRSRDSTS